MTVKRHIIEMKDKASSEVVSLTARVEGQYNNGTPIISLFCEDGQPYAHLTLSITGHEPSFVSEVNLTLGQLMYEKGLQPILVKLYSENRHLIDLLETGVFSHVEDVILPPFDAKCAIWLIEDPSALDDPRQLLNEEVDKYF